MEFWVQLIVVVNGEKHKKLLKENCTHVEHNKWIFEGDAGWLEDAGVGFDIIGEGVVPSLGGLSKNKLKEIAGGLQI